VNFTNWLMGHGQIALTEKQRSTHTYVIGQSGTGKSRALESWVMQDVLAGHGVAVIDPHGDLFANLVARLATRPQLWKKVILLDPSDPEWCVGFNPLKAADGVAPERVALYMTDVCIKVWKVDPASAPRMVWLLTNTFLALGQLNLTLLHLPRFLADREFRESLLPAVNLPQVITYFEHEFPKHPNEVQQWIAPVLNKLGSLVFDPDIRLLFAGGATLNFRQVMDEQMILLVNLSKGIFGEGLSALLAAFMVAQIQQAALSRANSTSRPPFYLYLDEFQNYTTDNISDILSESRKYALSLILAHQYLDQLPANLKAAVLNTAGTLVSFRVGYQDARTLAKEIFPAPDFLSGLPMRIPGSQEAGWEALALELASLEPRQFWQRRRGNFAPVKQMSFWMPQPEVDSGKQEALRQYSGQRFAQRKAEVRQSQQTDPNYEASLPFWTV